MALVYVQAGNTITLAAPYDRTSGQGAQVGSLFGVALQTVLNTVEGEFAVEGVWTLAKTSAQAWTRGQKIYWDNSNKRCDSDGTVGMLIGVATVVADNPSSTGTVRLNGVAPDTAEGPQAAIASLTDNGGGTADGTVAAQAEPVSLTDSTGVSGSHDDTLADGLTASAPAAITDYTAHASGGTTVTSAGATDLDSTAAALALLVDEVTALTAVVDDVVTDLGVQNQNDSDLAQKVIELVALAAVQQDNMKELTTKVEAILVALRAYGVIAA